VKKGESEERRVEFHLVERMGATSAVLRLAALFLLRPSVSTVLTSANVERGSPFTRGLE